MWANKDIPCGDCAYRRVGCHGNCTDYRNFKLKLQTIKDKKMAEYEVDYALKQNRKSLRKLSFYYEKQEEINE